MLYSNIHIQPVFKYLFSKATVPNHCFVTQYNPFVHQEPEIMISLRYTVTRSNKRVKGGEYHQAQISAWEPRKSIQQNAEFHQLGKIATEDATPQETEEAILWFIHSNGSRGENLYQTHDSTAGGTKWSNHKTKPKNQFNTQTTQRYNHFHESCTRLKAIKALQNWAVEVYLLYLLCPKTFYVT